MNIKQTYAKKKFLKRKKCKTVTPYGYTESDGFWSNIRESK